MLLFHNFWLDVVASAPLLRSKLFDTTRVVVHKLHRILNEQHCRIVIYNS